ncbi:MAG: hypothetical protein ACKVJW_07235 [Flavobacteriales bacterium]
MKKTLIILLCLFSLNTLSYASFPTIEISSSEVEIAEGVFDDDDDPSEKLIQYISMLIFATGFYFLFRAWWRAWRNDIRWVKILTYSIFTFVLLILLIPLLFGDLAGM